MGLESVGVVDLVVGGRLELAVVTRAEAGAAESASVVARFWEA